MRTLTIIDLAPVVKMGLAFDEAAPGMVAQEFLFQGPMKAFVFTIGLWVIRTCE